MKTAEGKLKVELKKYLDAWDAYYFMPVQTGYGKTTLDFLVCLEGRFIGIETKAPGKMPTPRQRKVMEEIRWANGFVFWTDSIEHAVKSLNEIRNYIHRK